MVFSVVDLTIWPDVGVGAVRVLHVPVEFFFCATGRRMRDPFVPHRVHVSSLRPAGWVSWPVTALGRVERAPSASGQMPPRILGRPITPRAHANRALLPLNGRGRFAADIV